MRDITTCISRNLLHENDTSALLQQKEIILSIFQHRHHNKPINIIIALLLLLLLAYELSPKTLGRTAVWCVTQAGIYTACLFLIYVLLIKNMFMVRSPYSSRACLCLHYFDLCVLWKTSQSFR